MSTEYTDVRQHILDTAKPLILGKGFSALGLSELLTQAGVPKGSFYHYFKSKELFGQALLDDYFADYQRHLQAMLESDQGNAAERLMRYWMTWLETQSSQCIDGKCLTVKLSGEVSDLSEAMREALHNGTSRIIGSIADCLRVGATDGSLPAAINAQSSALTLYSLWLGASLLTKIRHDRSALEAALATTRTLLSLPPAG